MYEFHGFFATPSHGLADHVLEKWRGWVKEIRQPFEGIGFRCPDDIERGRCCSKGRRLLDFSREHSGVTFVYIEYETWGGDVEYVRGKVYRNGTEIFHYEAEEQNARLQPLLGYLGLVLGESEYFAPFHPRLF